MNFFLRILSKVFTAIIDKWVTLLFTTIVASGTSWYNMYYTDLKVNSTFHVDTRHRNSVVTQMSSLAEQCGESTGVSWMEVRSIDAKNKKLSFEEVLAVLPGTTRAIQVKTLSPFYMGEHPLDHYTLEYFQEMVDGEVQIVTPKIVEEKNLVFLKKVYANAWKQTNVDRVKKNMPKIDLDSIYLSIVRKNSEIVYVFSLALDTKESCEVFNDIEGTKLQISRIALFAKEQILKESI